MLEKKENVEKKGMKKKKKKKKSPGKTAQKKE